MKLISKLADRNTYALSFVLSIILVLCWLIFSSHHEKDFDCSSYLRIESVASSFDAKFKTFLLMREDNSGYFDISGKVDAEGKIFNVERAYHFDYEKKVNNIYFLTNISVSKRNADNILENVMQKIFSGPNTDAKRYIKIQKIKNAYLIQNLHSPSFMCIDN